MPLNAQVSVSVLVHESTSDSLSSALRVTPAMYSASLSNGTGANQAQIAYSETGTIPGGNEVLLTFGSLSDDRGAVAMTAIKAIYIKSTGAEGLSVSGHLWGDSPVGSLLVSPGCVFVLTNTSAAGWSTTQSGAGMVIANTSQAATSYEIVLIGEGTVS